MTDSEKVVIFGTKDLAELAKYYLETDTKHEVVAFTVDKEYLPESKQYLGLPVVAFEDITMQYPPAKFKLFAPMTGSRMSKNRERVYLEGKVKGYEFISYVSSHATVLNEEIGENCFILEDNTIQPFVRVGNNVVMWSGCHIGHHSVIEDNSFFTSHVVLSGHCNVKRNSWFGVNSTIRDGLTIAEGTLLAMGACLTKNSEPWSMYMGTPAKKSEKTSLEANP